MTTAYAASTTSADLRARPPLSALNRLTVASLLGSALSLVYVQVFLIGQVDPPLAVFAVLELLCAGLVAGVPVGRWRWTPLLATLFGVFVLVGNWEPIVYDLTHPAAFHSFAFMVVAVAIAVVSIVVGIAATVQNYRHPAGERPAPRGMGTALVGVAALCLGAILVGRIPQASTVAVSPEVLAELPAVTTHDFSFDRPEIRVRVGETVALRLDNHHNVPHSFDIDELDVHVPMPPGESSLAIFKVTTPGTYTYYCDIPGHVEAGMEGKLIVEP